ncbi:MAG: phosphoglycerate kinase [Pirellulales bacterium]|nr:phosphoglycerate kinase [Pirellulales bacterium]
MSIATETMAAWCRMLLTDDSESSRSIGNDFLAGIPRLECFGDLPAGTPVLVRGDVDAKPGPLVGEGDIRLRSMKATLEFGRRRGWRQIIFGHVGRDPQKSLAKVAARIGEILDCPVEFVPDWLDPETTTIKDDLSAKIARLPDGGIIVLENTRKYEIERALWKAKPDDLDRLAEPLARLADQFAAKVARAYVHEAFSAGSFDASSVVVPAAMKKVALGKYEAEQFAGHLKECLNAQMVIFSGLKIDKLDDLQAMIDRGKVRTVIAAGSLAVALNKAAARLNGGDFDIGLSQDSQHKDKPYYISPQRIEQAERMMAEGRKKGIEFVLPVDFVLADGRASETIGPGNQQYDVGPASGDLYEKKVDDFIAAHRSDRPAAVVFHNGVFGMFEDPRFENGTRRFIAQLKRMTDAGIKVYVGGGEGGTALEKYGQPNWVTYCFTAGGTVLGALAGEPIPYLVALRMAAEKMGPPR